MVLLLLVNIIVGFLVLIYFFVVLGIVMLVIEVYFINLFVVVLENFSLLSIIVGLILDIKVLFLVIE